MRIRLALLLLTLSACSDSISSLDSDSISPPPQSDSSSFRTERQPVKLGSEDIALARANLNRSLVPGSVDDIFARLADRFDGFGGVFVDDDGFLVLVSAKPEVAESRKGEIVSTLLDLATITGRARDVLSRKDIRIRSGVYNFTELAIYRAVIETHLSSTIPIVLLDVDERQNVVLIGIDKDSKVSVEYVRSKAIEIGIPPAAIGIEYLPMPRSAAAQFPHPEPPASAMAFTLTDSVRPLAGGIKIDRDGGCTLGIPIWYGSSGNQVRGFLTASHCTGFVGFNNQSEWGQPLQNDQPIGVEFEDPPLTDCDSTTLLCLTDVALIDLNLTHDNSQNTLVSSVYRTDFSSSTGLGGSAISGEPVRLSPQSGVLMGMDVNKVGVRTGWTTGDITGTCVTISIEVRHADGVVRFTRLPCYIRASTPVNTGDSGSALFSIISDPVPQDEGRFFGILSACSGCNGDVASVTGDGFYVSWSAISQALVANISFSEDQGGL